MPHESEILREVIMTTEQALKQVQDAALAAFNLLSSPEALGGGARVCMVVKEEVDRLLQQLCEDETDKNNKISITPQSNLPRGGWF